MQIQTNADIQNQLQKLADINKQTLNQVTNQEALNESLQEKLSEQERKLTNVDAIVDSFFTEWTNTEITGSDTNSVCILNTGGKGTIVLFRLLDAPIIGSFQGFVEPPGESSIPILPSVGYNNNILTTVFAGSPGQLKLATFSIA